jgi:hypothetical protein
MNKLLLGTLALAVAFSIGAPNAFADHDDHGNGHGYGHGNKHAKYDDEQGWEHREGYEYRTYAGNGHYPPGWNRGNKTGWGNCGMPPGQAKKYGCRTYTYQGHPYFYYQDDRGQIYVRRPLIEVQAGVTIAP